MNNPERVKNCEGSKISLCKPTSSPVSRPWTRAEDTRFLGQRQRALMLTAKAASDHKFLPPNPYPTRLCAMRCVTGREHAEMGESSLVQRGRGLLFAWRTHCLIPQNYSLQTQL